MDLKPYRIHREFILLLYVGTYCTYVIIIFILDRLSKIKVHQNVSI